MECFTETSKQTRGEKGLIFFDNIIIMFLTLFCLAVLEKYAVNLVEFPLMCAENIWKMDIFILFKLIIVAPFVFISFLGIIATPMYFIYIPKWILVYSSLLTMRSKVKSFIFETLFAVATYFHYKLNWMNHDLFYRIINPWNLSMAISVLMFASFLFDKEKTVKGDSIHMYPPASFFVFSGLSYFCYAVIQIF